MRGDGSCGSVFKATDKSTKRVRFAAEGLPQAQIQEIGLPELRAAEEKIWVLLWRMLSLQTKDEDGRQGGLRTGDGHDEPDPVGAIPDPVRASAEPDPDGAAGPDLFVDETLEKLLQELQQEAAGGPRGPQPRDADLDAVGAKDPSIWAAQCVAWRRRFLLGDLFAGWAFYCEGMRDIRSGDSAYTDEDLARYEAEDNWPEELIEWMGPQECRLSCA